MASMLSKSAAIDLRTFCDAYAGEIADATPEVVADWLLAAYHSEQLAPHQLLYAKGRTIMHAREEITPAQLHEWLQGVSARHLLRTKQGAVVPIADGMAPDETFLSVLGRHLVVPRELALAFAL